MAKKQKLSKHKFAGRNNGPARQRYWASGRLKKNKVRRIVKATGWSWVEAATYWDRVRKGRMKTYDSKK